VNTPAVWQAGVRFGPFELDPQTSELRKSGYRVKLAPQPAKLKYDQVATAIRRVLEVRDHLEQPRLRL